MVIRGKAGKPKCQKQMGWVRAKGLIGATAAAMVWLDKNDHWAAPRHFEDAFVPPKMSADEERQSKKIQIFTLDEVKIIHRVANNWQKILIQAGVFLGWTQIDLAWLRKDELVDVNGEMFVDYSRHKTGVPNRLWVPPELAQKFREYRDAPETRPNPHNLLFQTLRDGHPIVYEHPKTGKHIDSTKCQWKQVRNLFLGKGVRPLPFKTLRKFAGQCIKNIAGHEMNKTFLAQTLGENGRDINEKHYTGSGIDVGVGTTLFSKLHDAQRKVYEALKPHLFGALKNTPKRIGEEVASQATETKNAQEKNAA